MKKKHLLLAAMVCFIAALTSQAQNVPNYVPQNGLVGWWPFNGNANDESGNGNNGTVNGATLTTDRFNLNHSAYQFFDSVGVNGGIINVLNPILPDSFSISVFFNNFYDYPGNYVSSLISNHDHPNGYELNLNYGLVKEHYSDTNNAHFCNPVLNIKSNSWYHYVWTKNKSISKIYLNGQLVSVKNNINQTTNSNKLLFFGRSAWGGNIFRGKLDDIGIWSRALSEQEIKNIYNGNICYQNVTVTDTLLINTTITGFNPITYQNTIKVYPNPSKDQITVDFGNFNTLNGYQLKITNSIGQQMYQTAINKQSVNISLGSWTGKGLYIIQIINSSGTTIETRKILIQ